MKRVVISRFISSMLLIGLRDVTICTHIRY